MNGCRWCHVGSMLKDFSHEVLVFGTINIPAVLTVVVNSCLLGKHDLQHWPNVLHDCRDAGFSEDSFQTAAEEFRYAPGVPEGGPIIFVEHLDTGACGMQPHTGGIVCAIVEDTTPGQRLHNVGPANKTGHRQPGTQRFPKGRDVRSEMVIFLAATSRDAEPRHRLVKNKEDVVGMSQLFQG